MLAVLALTLVFVVGAGILANRWRAGEPLARIDVEGAKLIGADEIRVATGLTVPGAAISTIDLRGVRERVRALPYVASADVTLAPHAGVKVTVAERRPIAVLALDTGMVTLADDGALLPFRPVAGGADLPVVTGASRNASPDSASLRAAAAVLAAARDRSPAMYRRISELAIAPDGSIALRAVGADAAIVFGRADRADEKFAMLDRFWRQEMSRRGPAAAGAIDARFENMIVARWAAAQ